MKHRPKVRKELRDYGVRYQVRCTCGVTGPEHAIPSAARDDVTAHLEAVAAPESERCRAPREHRSEWWETCLLCTAQEALISLEELGVA